MKQLSSEKYTVAWFKLAEFVSRGEKERALAMYRLLAHSLDDKAFVSQLEGDLLLSFDDDEAFNRYVNAVMLYHKKTRTNEAIAVYEHLVMLEPKQQEQLKQIVELYEALKQEPRIVHATERLMRLLMEDEHYEHVSWLLQVLDKKESVSSFSTIHQELIQAWSQTEEPPTTSLLVHVKTLIDTYLIAKQQRMLQTFLTTLQLINGPLYKEAYLYMQDGKLSL